MKHDVQQLGPQHFECRHCHTIWNIAPDPRSLRYLRCHGLVVTTHDIFRSAPDQFECRRCHTAWKTKPKTRCPGLRLYSQYGHEPFLTRLQLGYAGYEIAEASLPAPVGCFNSRGRYVRLYDPTQATRKTASARKRKTNTLSDIFWPRDGLSLLESHLHLKRVQDDWFVGRAEGELASMAYHFSQFTAEEVEQISGGYVHLKIAACLVHPTFSAFQASWSQSAVLVKSVLAAYEKQRPAQ